MAASLNASSAAITSAITVYLAAFALGQLAAGPISDRYGRRLPASPCSLPAASGAALPPTCRAF
jgi:MFS family permease